MIKMRESNCAVVEGRTRPPQLQRPGPNSPHRILDRPEFLVED
jgi:hypothetical protein